MKVGARLKGRHLIRTVARCLNTGSYLDTRHAAQRRMERGITRPEVIHVLRRGYHESRKDRYVERFRAWNYALRGLTPDRRDLRVIVSFDKDRLLVITAIVLRSKHEGRKN